MNFFAGARSCYQVKVGDIAICAINDGFDHLAFTDIVSTDRDLCQQLHENEFRSVPPLLTINCFLIQSQDRLALIDAGYPTPTRTSGKLVEHLNSLGIRPADIDTILMTHMHADHSAGLLDAADRPTFPNATVFLHKDELAFWLDEEAFARASQVSQDEFRLVRRVVRAYGERITQLDAEAGHVFPGVRIIETPGHTPGHTAWLVESGSESLLVWGDIIHFPAIQFALPDACVVYDVDPNAAADARKKTLAFAAEQKLRVAGSHLDFPSFGHVVADGTGYRFVPEVWHPAEQADRAS
ncbi:MBL fold metallo-hydrolase [Mesorhizobium silamurunense]|uniref:MBL fold metallo-hydrolase n=1 Tax=Mesorhizobium silamurunense TaxID=499528 RepID=UPI00177F4228|nr:MBL fold metallo-hydrolase [Mesorhizobium silamurunense]